MTDNARGPSYPYEPTMEVKGDGYLWKLNDGAYFLIKMQSPMTAMVQMWQGTEFVGPFEGHIFSDTFRDRMAKKAKQRFGTNAPRIAEDIEWVAQKLGVPGDSGKNLIDELREATERSPVDRLIIYARSAATFFHNKDHEAFATIEREGHEETYELESPRFKLWMRSEYWRRETERLEDAALVEAGPLYEGEYPLRAGLPDVIREQNITDALSQLESIAIFEGAQQEVYVRCAHHEGTFYYDMGDPQWRVIEISNGEWQIVSGKDVPVRFVRPKGLLELPEPVESEKGSFEAIDAVLNLGSGEDGKRNRILLLGWLTYCMLPNGPYPIVHITGPQGAAKTTAVVTLRQLIDPNSAPKGTKPKSEHDTYIDAAANWVLAYDQLVSIPVWFSNVLCDVATGGGYRTRTLYSNRDQEIFSDTRPIVVSGIGNIASRPDFLERALMISLPRITEDQRQRPSVMKRRVREARPSIFTALLDATAAGLAKVDSIPEQPWPRMADFCHWGLAVEAALGAEEGEFKKAMVGSTEDATEVSLEEWPMTDIFEAFAELHVGEANAFNGNATQLDTELKNVAGESVAHSKQWPGSPSALMREVNEHIDALGKIGIVVAAGKGSERRKKLIYKKP